jgi:hypothetical protein
MAVLV